MWKSQSQISVFKRETLKEKLYIKSINSLQSYVSREVPINRIATGRKRKVLLFFNDGEILPYLYANRNNVFSCTKSGTE